MKPLFRSLLVTFVASLVSTASAQTVSPSAEATIGVLVGHGEPTLNEGLTTLQRMLPRYALREVSAAQPIEAELRALLIIQPEDEWYPELVGPRVLSVALDARLPSAFDARMSERPARVLVLGSSTPLHDAFLPVRDGIPDAELASIMAFALNAIDWLASTRAQ